jgi:large subunit ribosomal protein L30e
MSKEDLITYTKNGKLLLGMKSTIKAIRKSAVSKVFLAKNCPEVIAEDIEHYCSLADIVVERLNIDCDELGTLCKKPFYVSVIGVKI